MTNVAEIEGVGAAYAEKLEAAGIPTVEGLLDAGATTHGRKEVAEKTGISEHLILKWVNHSDLFRINGVAGEYAELLEASGVDTVAELAQRNAANLQAKMAEVNESKKLVRRVPAETEVETWVTEAKTLPRRVEY
jgi:predicted flap endonuclease-1-like 5' DNA nuclease